MKQTLLFLFILFICASVHGQATGNVTMALYAGAPTGTCNSRQLAMDTTTGNMYSCSTSNTWQAFGGGTTGPAGPTGPAGSAATVNVGTVTNVPPINSTTVGNATVTNAGTTSAATFNFGIPQGLTGATGPAGPQGPPGSAGSSTTGLTFGSTTLSLGSTAPTSGQYLFFDGTNIIGGTAPGGGGSGLDGCTTPSAGNLVCDASVTGGTGTVGLLTFPYSSAGLPPVPQDAHAAVAADDTGALNWSPGNGVDWSPIGSGGGGGGPGPGVTFPDPCNTVGYTAGTGTCADLQSNVVTDTAYTISSNDLNHVIIHQVAGQVVDTLPTPSDGVSHPFRFWLDTNCTASITVNTGSGSLVNGRSSLDIHPCGWAMVWVDQDGLNWRAQIFQPPGGVTVIQ